MSARRTATQEDVREAFEAIRALVQRLDAHPEALAEALEQVAHQASEEAATVRDRLHPEIVETP